MARAASLRLDQGVYEVNKTLNAAIESAASVPVDQLPILKYIPERWAYWKR
jgi:hypothetical protein